MQTSYKKLLKIKLTHDYYQLTDFRDLSIIPSRDCYETMRDHGLIINKVNDGIHISYEKDPTTEEDVPLRLTSSEEIKLTFLVKAKSTDFYGFTDLSMDFKHPYIFYWSNLVDNSSRDDLYLSKDASTSVKDQVKYASSMINISGESELDKVRVSIKDIHDTEVLTVDCGVDREESSYQKQLVLDRFPDGVYTVLVEEELYTKIYKTDTLDTSALLGLVEIYFGADVPAENALFDAGLIEPRDYLIHFGVRNTYWKYYIVLGAMETDPGLEIVYDDAIREGQPYPEGIGFETTETDSDEETDPIVTTYGEDGVLILQSDDTLPFFESPKLGISLNKPTAVSLLSEEDEEDESSTIEVIKNLPNPSPYRMKPSKDGDKLYSEIFIYL